MRFATFRWATCITLGCLASGSRAQAQHNENQAESPGSELSAAAQRISVVRLLPGVQLGGALPTSGLGDLYSTGFRAGLTLTAVFPTMPYGVRAAVTYDRFGGGTVTPQGSPPIVLDAASMTSVTVAGLISERSTRSALLYFTGGLGVHRLDAERVDTLGIGDEEPTDVPGVPVAIEDAETKFGALIGVGLTFRIAGLPSYMEVQAVKLFGRDALVVPVVIGLQFGR